MKKTIKLAVVAALALGTTSAFATNGDNLIATGAKARAMGGVGIATSFGAESSIANPALLSSVKNSEFSGSITAFMPDVEVKSDYGNSAGSFAKSKADFSLIPEFAYATRVNDNLVLGVSVTGTAGMGMDSSGNDTPNVQQMTTELALMKIATPISYQMGKLSLGASPIFQYGTLEISNQATVSNKTSRGSDLNLGYELGAAYEVSTDLTVGAVYKSKLHMQYANVISRSVDAFGGSAATGVGSGDVLDQPAEYGVGVSYVIGASTIAVDYKRIEWASASGYSDFSWDDQDVYAIGYEYNAKSYSLRAGYNYAKSPISEQPSTSTGYAARNFFNLSGFPGTVESHYTFGLGYNMSDDLSIDLAVVYAAEKTDSFSIAAYGAAGNTVDTKHSQLGATVGATYKF